MAEQTARICVVGSMMIDLVLRVPRLPVAGETLLANAADLFLGGKGANQAVAARRLGARTALIGRVGDDAFGQMFLDALAREDIDCSGLVVDQEAGTGLAVPLVEPNGANTIVVGARANRRLSASDIDRGGALIAAADTLLVQCEVAPAATRRAVDLARAAGRRVVLNPAPAPDDIADLLPLVDVVTPNEREAAQLTGRPVATVAEAQRAALALHAPGRRCAVVTLGGAGAVAAIDGVATHYPALPTTVVDTTAAGDAFTAALAVRLAEGATLPEAMRWALAAGARAVAVMGAQPSLADRATLERMLAYTT